MQFLANSGIFDKGLKFRAMTLPDIFIDHEKPEKQYEIAGLKRSNIVATALLALGETSKIHSDITPAIA
jgi:1-deoxy-D-xylulose-5-phosphate synthase